MPQLLLLRHAKARAHSPEGDFARELSKRGRNDAVRLGAYLAGRGIVPDVTISSPARRTRQTTELILGEMPQAPGALFDNALYNASADVIMRAMTRGGGGARVLLVVGHNPGIGELAHALALSGGENLAELQSDYPTCALAIFETTADISDRNSDQFHLLKLLTPDIIPHDGNVGG